jgi:magnesium transporter
MSAAGSTFLTDLSLEFAARHPESAARALQDTDADEAAALLAAAPPREVAAVLGRLGADSAMRILRRMPPELAPRTLSDADPALASALLRRIPDDQARQSVLATLAAPRRRELELFLSFPENSAGSLMDPQAPAFRHDTRAGDVAAALRESRRVRDQVVMVTDEEQRLIGAVAVVEVLVAPPDVRLSALAVQATPSIEAFAHRDEVAERLEHQRLAALPVVDLDGRPVGLLSQRALARVAELEVAADVQSMVGASRDERALSPVGFAVRKRLPWLQINLATAFLAAGVVGLFEGTIARYTALAILLPVVAGQSGNTGAQALAVTMRALSLHEIGLRHWVRVAVKEAAAGLGNGVAVAATTMLGVYVWSGSAGLCAIIGMAMVLSMTIAGVAGASVPMILRAFGQDPAQSSSIVLTTITDVVGFSSFLGLATLLALWL